MQPTWTGRTYPQPQFKFVYLYTPSLAFLVRTYMQRACGATRNEGFHAPCAFHHMHHVGLHFPIAETLVSDVFPSDI